MSQHFSPKLHYIWILPLCLLNNTPLLFKYGFDIVRDIINASANYVEVVAEDVCKLVDMYCLEKTPDEESVSDSHSVTDTEEEISETDDKKNV